MANGMLEDARSWTVNVSVTTTTTTTGTTTTGVETTSTTTAVATSTTSTQPPGTPSTACQVSATFGSLECRLAQLTDTTTKTAALEPLRAGLLRKLAAAAKHTDTAAQAQLDGRRRRARVTLGKAARALVGFRKRLATRRARRTVPEALRDELSDRAMAVFEDARALRTAL
jgi:hypothetical protein